MNDYHDIYLLIFLCICILLFFIHSIYNYVLYKEIFYAKECYNAPRKVEYNSLRNRIYRNNLFNRDNYKTSLFALIIVIIILYILFKILFIVNYKVIFELFIFIFILGFLISHCIVFSNGSSMRHAYDKYRQDIDLMKNDPINKQNAAQGDFYNALKENILIVHPDTINVDNLLADLIKNGDFIHYVDFTDYRTNLVMNNLNYDIEWYKSANNFTLINDTRYFAFNLMNGIKDYNLGPSIMFGIALHEFNYLLCTVSITLLLMYLFKNRWA